MSSPDFDILGQINIQLAKDAGAKLSKDLEKHLAKDFTVKPKIEPILKRSAEINKIFLKPGETTKKIPISISISNKATFDKFFKDRKIKVDIDISKSTLASFDKLNDALAKIDKTVGGLDRLNDIGAGLKAAVAGVNVTATAKKSADTIDKLIKKFTKLGKDATAGNLNNSFLQEMITDTERLRTELGKSNFADTMKKIYNGLNDKPAKNFLNAIENIVYAMRELDSKRNSLDKRGLLASDPSLNVQLDATRAKLFDILKSLDAASKVSLESAIQGALAPLNDAVRASSIFERNISSLQTKIAEALATGSNDGLVQNLEKRVKLLREARANGIDPGVVKSSPEYLATAGGGKNLSNLERLTKSILRNVNKAAFDLDNIDLYKTAGAVVLNTRQNVQNLISDTRTLINEQLRLNNPTAEKAIQEAYDKLAGNITKAKASAVDFNKALENLDNKKAYYDAKGLGLSSAKVTEVQAELVKLAQAGDKVGLSSKAFIEFNQGIEVLAQNESKIQRFINSIDRLRASLQLDLASGADFAGVEKTLNQLESYFNTAAQTGNVDDRDMRKQLTAESYRVRSQNKLNKVIQGSLQSFDDAIFEKTAAHGEGKAIPRIFEAGKSGFEGFLNTLDLSNGSFDAITKNISKVKQAFDGFYFNSQVTAEGGIFGILGKSIGLATKRLGSFLIAARGVYAFQNAMIESTGAAIELDTEFTRLQQIFAGSDDTIGSAAENTAKLGREILALGKNYGISSVEIAKSADILAQAGSDITKGGGLEKLLNITTRARLGPTFKDSIQITEAMIASMNQFELSAGDMESVIGGISQVSAQYAVESDGITKAIRRAGGAFAAAKADGQSYLGALGDFVGAFTILKEQTREADETLATSLRNVLNRLQRRSVQKFLKDSFNIDLLDQNNQFVGFSNAIGAVSSKIKELNIQSGDPRFAELVQKLAGSLQSSRLTSLLQDSDRIQKAVADFGKGGSVLDRDAAIAFDSVANKIERAKNAAVELFTELLRTEAVKSLIELFTTLANVLSGVVVGINNLAKSFGVIGTATVLAGITSLLKPIFNIRQNIRNLATGLSAGFNNGHSSLGSPFSDPFSKFNDGGLIPGRGANKDSVLAYLTKGEYVIQRPAVDALGKNFFDQANKGIVPRNSGGIIPGYNSGGRINDGSGLNTLASVLESKFGIIIKNLDKIVSKFGNRPELENAGGTFNYATKELNSADVSNLPHEIAHAIHGEMRDSGITDKEILNAIPPYQAKETAFRVSSRPDVYGDNPSKETLNSETIADYIETQLQGVSSGFSIDGSMKDLFEKVGIELTQAIQVNVDSLMDMAASIQDNGDYSDIANSSSSVKSYSKKDIEYANLAQQKGYNAADQYLGSNKPSAGGGFIPSNPYSNFMSGAGGRGSGGGGAAAAAAGGAAAGGAKSLSSLFAGLGKYNLLLTGGTAILATYLNSSKSANDSLQPLIKAFTVATASLIAFSSAVSLATSLKKSEAFTGVLGNLKGKGLGKAGDLFNKIPGSGVLKSLFGKASAVKGSVGSAISAGGARAAAAGSAIFPTFGAGLSKAGTALAGNLLAVAGAAVTVESFFNSLAQSSIEASQKIIDSSTNEQEVREQLANIEKKESAQRGGRIARNVTLGAAAGSAIPVLGTAAGAAAGLLLSFADAFPSVITPLRDFGGWLSGWGAAIGDVAIGALSSLANGLDSAAAAALNFVGVDTGVKRREEANTFRENIALSGANINSFNKAANSRGGLTRGDGDNLVRGATQLNGAFANYGSLGEEQQKIVKQQAERFRDALNISKPLQRARILEQAKKSGVDLIAMFEKMDIQFNAVESASAVAFDEMSRVLLGMGNLAKNLTSTLDVANANVDAIGQLAAGASGEGFTRSTPSSAFDALRNGQRVTGVAGQFLQQDLAAFQQFSPQAAQNAQFEFAATAGARNLSASIANNSLKLGDGGFNQARDAITANFNQSTTGVDPAIKDKLQDFFANYIDSQEEAITVAVGGGTPDASKIDEITNGFLEKVKTGGIDLLQKFSESNSQFKQAMDGIIKRRLDLENKTNDYLKSNVDKQKSLLEIQNKVKGKSGDVSFSQAQGLDASRRAIGLRGTGLGGDASIADMQARYSQLSAADPTGANPQVQFLKENIQKVLQDTANGTDSLATAMKEFDKALETSKRRAEELSNALLGTDENMVNMIDGMYLANQVQNAGSSTEAYLALQNSSDGARSYLQSQISGDEDAQLAFQKKLGIAPRNNKLPEAGAAIDQVQQQIDANNALISINQNSVGVMNNLITAMVNNRTSIEAMAAQVNSFSTAATTLANNLTNIPQNITHTHSFTVEPIQVVITGGDGLNGLNDSTKQMVTGIVNAQIGKFANNLKTNNKGLSVDTLALNTAVS